MKAGIMGLLSVSSEARYLVLFSFDGMYVGGWGGQDQLGLGARLRVSAFKTNPSAHFFVLCSGLLCVSRTRSELLRNPSWAMCFYAGRSPGEGKGRRLHTPTDRAKTHLSLHAAKTA